MYRGQLKDLYALLSRTQAGLGRAVKQEQAQNSLATRYKQGSTNGMNFARIEQMTEMPFGGQRNLATFI